MFGDFKIDPETGDYKATATGDLATSEDMGNNVYMSLKVVKGSDIDDPAFGMDVLPNKAIALLPVIAKEKAEAALQWLLDTGRADSVEVEAELDESYDIPRLYLHVTAVQAGQPQAYSVFKEVS